MGLLFVPLLLSSFGQSAGFAAAGFFLGFSVHQILQQGCGLIFFWNGSARPRLAGLNRLRRGPAVTLKSFNLKCFAVKTVIVDCVSFSTRNRLFYWQSSTLWRVFKDNKRIGNSSATNKSGNKANLAWSLVNTFSVGAYGDLRQPLLLILSTVLTELTSWAKLTEFVTNHVFRNVAQEREHDRCEQRSYGLPFLG